MNWVAKTDSQSLTSLAVADVMQHATRIESTLPISARGDISFDTRNLQSSRNIGEIARAHLQNEALIPYASGRGLLITLSATILSPWIRNTSEAMLDTYTAFLSLSESLSQKYGIKLQLLNLTNHQIEGNDEPIQLLFLVDPSVASQKKLHDNINQELQAGMQTTTVRR
jgi:hypothetical protein